MTAACRAIPAPLPEPRAPGGRLIAPVLEKNVQLLTLLEKGNTGLSGTRCAQSCTCRCAGATSPDDRPKTR